MERKEKAESMGSTLCLERGWEDPSPTSESIVTASGCLCQGDFRAREGVCLAPAFVLSSVWGEDLGAWVRGGVFRWFRPSSPSSSVSLSGL